MKRKSGWSMLKAGLFGAATISLIPMATAMETVIEYEEWGDMDFQLGPPYCVDVSADGSIVLGATPFANWIGAGGEAFLWQDGEITDLDGFQEVYALSSDGKVVVGITYNSWERSHAMYWKDGTSYLLPELPGSVSSRATVVSADGSVMGGINYLQGGDEILPQTVIWKNGQVIALDGLSILPLGMSGDGNLIGGANGDTSEPWRPDAGFVYNIQNGEIYEFYDSSKCLVPWDISLDGTAVVGIWSDNFVYMWKGQYYGGAALGISPMGDTDPDGLAFPGYDVFAAESVSGDGSVVIGSLMPGQDYDDVIIWREEADWAPERLRQLLSDSGIELSAEDEFYHLTRLYDYMGGPAISDNGSTIVGTYIYTNNSGHNRRTGFIFRRYDLWASHRVKNSFVYAEDLFGLLCVKCAPWIWCPDADAHLYMAEECAEKGKGWIYVPDLDCMMLSIVSAGEHTLGWSPNLCRWFYVPPMTSMDSGGWIYAL